MGYCWIIRYYPGKLGSSDPAVSELFPSGLLCLVGLKLYVCLEKFPLSPPRSIAWEVQRTSGNKEVSLAVMCAACVEFWGLSSTWKISLGVGQVAFQLLESGVCIPVTSPVINWVACALVELCVTVCHFEMCPVLLRLRGSANGTQDVWCLQHLRVAAWALSSDWFLHAAFRLQDAVFWKNIA